MVAREVPQWVEQSFTRSALAVGASAGRDEIAACCDYVLDLWSKPDRYHHDVRHLFDMLTRIDAMASEIPHADQVRLAAWFHGIVFSTSNLAVYTRNGGEDEIASAKLAHQLLASLGIDEQTCSSVTKLIMGLKKPSKIDSGPEPAGPKLDETSSIEIIDIDQLALRDAHLGSLAVEPQKYKHYLDDLQQEYAHIPMGHFLRAREQIVSKLLARKKLFHSPLASQWEEPARDNLQAELERLRAKLAQLDAMPAERIREDVLERKAAEEGEQSAQKDGLVTQTKPLVTEIPEQQEEAGQKEEQEEPLEELQEVLSEVPALIVSPSEDTDHVSSLEKLDDMFSPGPAPKVNLTPEQAQLEERKKTAAQAWQTIANKAHNVLNSASGSLGASPTLINKPAGDSE